MRLLRALLTVIFCCPSSSLVVPAASGQESKVALPRVAAAQVPLYPRLAHIAHIQGFVHVKVSTDGHSVVATHVEYGHKLLAAAAEENVRTWRFTTHEPTTFTVTYRFKLVPGLEGDPENPTVVLPLPTEVEVATRPWPPIEGSASTSSSAPSRGIP